MTNDLPTAYPLQWPLARPRAAMREAAKFINAKQSHKPGIGYIPRPHSITEGATAILGELRMMDADATVISTNVRLRLDGWPRSDQSAPADPGVAVYFLRSGQSVCFACDKWNRVEDNLLAVFKTLEALRGVDRWGAANLQASFTGYLAIAAPAGSLWWEVLGVPARATAAEITAAYRAKAKALHPDAPGGSHDAFVKLQEAYQAAVAQGLVAA